MATRTLCLLWIFNGYSPSPGCLRYYDPKTPAAVSSPPQHTHTPIGFCNVQIMADPAPQTPERWVRDEGPGCVWSCPGTRPATTIPHNCKRTSSSKNPQPQPHAGHAGAVRRERDPGSRGGCRQQTTSARGAAAVAAHCRAAFTLPLSELRITGMRVQPACTLNKAPAAVLAPAPPSRGETAEFARLS